MTPSFSLRRVDSARIAIAESDAIAMLEWRSSSVGGGVGGSFVNEH